jgi:hypothetical protein
LGDILSRRNPDAEGHARLRQANKRYRYDSEVISGNSGMLMPARATECVVRCLL